jgi:hypothetical protein
MINKDMKLKDFKFKCGKMMKRDNNGYSHIMEVYDLYGNYIYGLKYSSGESPSSPYSKQSTKVELVNYIKKNEQDIYAKIATRSQI